MLSPGAYVGNFQVVREIGRGAMGVVYEALHQHIERRAAIKVLFPHLSRDPEARQRFQNEARAANRVRHPGLVDVFEFGWLPEGSAFIIMEFLDGETLRERLERLAGPMPPVPAVSVCRQLAATLAAAHAAGVIHRDLKPDNVMLVPDPERVEQERVKILDFGIAKLREQPIGSGAPLTRAGIVMGTVEYMAPEQCRASSQVDGKADVYSLGIMLYEMLAGARPFAGEHMLVVLNKQLLAAPPPLAERAPGLDPVLLALVSAMLAKSPEQRPDMAQVLAQLMALGRAGEPEPAAEPVAPIPREARGAEVAVAPAHRMSPFIAGPPITQPRAFFGRSRELRRLANLWQQPPLQNAAVIGPRRSGKTSLLHYLRSVRGAADLRPGQRGDHLLALGRQRFVFVDFQDPRLGTRDGLMRYLLACMGLEGPQQLDLDSFLCTVSERLQDPTVLLMDEIDVALERYQELDDSFWDAMRALATNQVGGNLGFVLASHEEPGALAQGSGRGSPFFNIFGYTATLGPLTEAEARELLACSPAPIPPRQAEWILAESGRWPLLLQILCRECVLGLQDGDTSDEWRQEGLRQIAPFRHLLDTGRRR